MHATTISILGLAVAGVSLAQTSVVTLYIPGADVQPLAGSIVGSDATATTYVLQCAPGTDSDNCGFDGPFTLTEGPKTAIYTLPAVQDENDNILFAGYIDCSLAGTTSAVCIQSFGGSEANFPGQTTVTYTGTDVEYMPVTITARAAAKPTAGGSPSSAAPSTTPAASGPTSTAAKPSGTSSSGAANASGSAVPKETPNAASWTGANVKLVLGGAAAVLALL
ncbi:hypothetical protein F5884DRAFT_838570 [Xylogone sp. PMI_703]|nr:hypothetical protein F5884DRAFT_838570 [Xylogone sp. PMI_703]